MKKESLTSRFACVVVVIALAGAAGAQIPSPVLPSPAEILTRHLAAAGGAETIRKTRTLIVKGKVEMLKEGIEAPFEFMVGPSNQFLGRLYYHHKFFGKLRLPGIGKINFEVGYDGRGGWWIDEEETPALLPEGNRLLFRGLIDLHCHLVNDRQFTLQRTLGLRKFDSRDCHEVLLVQPTGEHVLEYFDVQTGLRAGLVAPFTGTRGSLNPRLSFGDYRRFGDRLVPSRIEARLMEDHHRITVSEVHYLAVDAAAIVPPTKLAKNGGSRPTASPPPSAETLPRAREILDRYVAALGGREAIQRHQSVRFRGHYANLPDKWTGELEIVKARPNRMMARIDIRQWGRYRQGDDGQIVWRIRPREGAGLYQGAEREEQHFWDHFEAELHDPARYRLQETVGRVRFDLRDCYQVVLVRRSGTVEMEFFEKESGLLAGRVMPDGGSEGYVNKIETFSDYRLFGDLRWPVKWVETRRIYIQIYTTTSVTYNDATDDEFKLPPEVQALLKK